MATTLIIIFIVSYVLIALENALRFDKSAIALGSAAILWTLVAFSGLPGIGIHEALSERLAPIAEIIIFLMGAMTIVEVIDSHDGFSVITDRIRTGNKRVLLATIGIITFILSAVLDNLATTIVMMTVTLRLVKEARDKVLFTGIVVIAANAGGAFSPIGDVTTTMLWIGGQISSGSVVAWLVLPSMVALAVPLKVALLLVGRSSLAPVDAGTGPSTAESGFPASPVKKWERNLVFFAGIGSLIAVPFFKIATGLPPFMGVLGALAFIWILTEALGKSRSGIELLHLSVAKALRKIDLPSILFFVGILLSVAALEVGGILHSLAQWLDAAVGDRRLIVIALGILSAVFDNVPLVAASMQMYSLDKIPMDGGFWHLLAFAAGTGGSMLIIGSAAGVAAMGSSKVSFGAYAAKIGPLALLGYICGIATYLAEAALFK